MSAKMIALIVLSGFFIFIIDLIRREKMTFKFAFGWLLAMAGGIIIVMADKLFERLASFLGFELLSNFIFFCCIGIAVLLGLLLTVFLCQQSRCNERLAKKIALLEYEINKARNQTESGVR